MTNSNYFNSKAECISYVTNWLTAMALNADIQECTDSTTGETKFAISLRDFCKKLVKSTPKMKKRKSGMKYQCRTSKMTNEVREMLNQGMTKTEIAKSLKISRPTLYSIIKNNNLE